MMRARGISQWSMYFILGMYLGQFQKSDFFGSFLGSLLWYPINCPICVSGYQSVPEWYVAFHKRYRQRYRHVVVKVRPDAEAARSIDYEERRPKV